MKREKTKSRKSLKEITKRLFSIENIERVVNQKPAKFTRLTAVIGASHDIYGRGSFYIGFVNTVMMFGVFFATVIIPTPALNWISLPMFFLIVLIAGITAAFIIWKILIPQMIAYGNYQGYRHDNPIRKDLEEIKQLLKDLESKN